MREISTSVTFEIKPGETVPMRIGRSTQLKVQGAAVWATRSNDIEDYWLVPGDKLKLRQRERLWLSVDGDRRRASRLHDLPAPRPARRHLARAFVRPARRTLPAGGGLRTV